MCFTEYLGYTCGHTSHPVKRPCPLTTQLHNNPCCPNSASRPILAQTMCPPCARILHGRYVDIIQNEHRFMHERGVCSCPIQFPDLQGPRLISPRYLPGGGESGTYMASFTALLAHPSAHNATSAPATSSAAESSAQGQGQSQDINSQFSALANPFVPGSRSYVSGNAGNASRAQGQATHASSNSTGSAQPQNQAGRNRGRRNNRRGRGSNQQASSSSSQAQTGPHLPPLFEEQQGGDSSSQGIRVVVRSPSLYCAEWRDDHAELHRDGRCNCNIRFDRYPGQYMDMLRDAYEKGERAERADTAAPIITVTATATGGGSSSIALDRHAMMAVDDSIIDMAPGHIEASAPLATTVSPAPVSAPASPSRNTTTEGTTASEQATTTQDPNPAPASAYPTTASWFIPPQQQAAAPGEIVRWACAPWDSSQGRIDETTGQTVNEVDRSHPVDVQGGYWQETGTPLAALPIGAGPDGDSHAPPFEDCELYYPPPSGDQRPASR
ncbi:hypothetical protein F4677DRAFT_449202 [Hypoxylon crocopeplum]|nr:hypothetical protein F4677DRAFT_449202 [Hypoxylon crocopeplum]